MKLTSARLLMALFLVAVLILATRLAWVAAKTETGWETLGLSWYNSMLSLIGREREPIGDRDPAEQAEIWLREVDRVLQAHPDDAQIAMGAAWMLDSPGHGFCRKHIKLKHTGATFPWPMIVPEVDDEAIVRAADRFEAKCATRCFELATRATELQPQNVGWWRMRALLLVRSGYFSNNSAPRHPDWLATLDESARHDPDNALYDYLAALALRITSEEYGGNSNNGLSFHVHDAKRLAQAIARFEQGQRKPCLAVGQAALPAVAEFLRHVRQPREQEADLAFERPVGYRAEMLPVRLRNWQQARAGAQEGAGNPGEAFALLRQSRHVLKQIMATGGSPDLRDWVGVLGPADVAALEKVAKRHPSLMTPGELAGLKREKEDLLVNRHVSDKASQQVGLFGPDRHPLETATPALVTGTAQTLVVPLLIFGIFGWGFARWLLKAPRPPPLGTPRHLLAWLLGWGLTVFLLGICPAEALGRPLQAGIIASGTCLLGTGILVVLFRKLVNLCRNWAEAPDGLPVISIIVLVTFWQLTVAVVLTTVHAALHPSRQYSQGVFILPFWLVATLALLAVIPLAAAIAVWVLFLIRHHLRTGRLPRAHFVTLGLLLLPALAVTEAFALYPDYLGADCWPPARGWEGVDVEILSIVLKAPQRPWRWAALQWAAYGGLYVSPGLSLLLVALWCTARRRREHRHKPPCDARPARRARCGGLLHCLGRSALGMAACCLLVYLAVAPAVLRAVENDYQHKMAYVRDPQAYWAKVRQAEAAIRADPAAMKEIRAVVAQQIAVYEDQSTDEESETDP